MAISARAAGTWAELTVDGTVAIPVGAVTGDRMFLLATWKAFSVTATVAGWTEITEYADGAVAAGAGTGSVKVGAWYKDHDGSEADPTLDFSAGVIAAAVIVAFAKDATETWFDPDIATAAIAAATSWTATGNRDPGIIAGDLAIELVGFRDDSSTMTRVATTALDAAGVTWAANYVEYPATHFSTTTGNDLAADAGYRIASVGASTAAPTGTGVLLASETGAALFIRQRAAVLDCYHDTVIADGPNAYWRLGEASGTNANDEIGTLDGTYVNTPTLGVAGALSGDSNTAATFVAANDEYVTVPDNAVIDLGDVFTFELWAKRTTTGTSMYLFHKGNNGPVISFFGDEVDLNKGGVGTSAVSTDIGTDTASWHHVVVTKNGAANKIYFDGVDVTGTVTNLTFASTADTLYVGNDPGSPGEEYNGSLDEVAIYATALTRDQVAEHYAARSVACAAVETNAPAGLASGTGAASGATTKVTPTSTVAAGTGAAHNAAASVKATAGAAAGTGAAHNAAASQTSNVSATAAIATGTGAASTASTSVTPVVSLASGSGAALDATVSAAGVAEAAAITATGTGAAGDGSTSIAPTSGVAAGTGAATDAAPSTTDEAPADTATGTGAASDPTTSIAPVVAVGSGTGSAFDATVSAAGVTNAAAGAATGTGQTLDATSSVAPTAGAATGTGTAHNVQASTTDEAPADTATGSGTANDASTSVAPVIGVADGTGAAFDATASTAGAGEAAAAPATGTGQAFDLSVVSAPTAQIASGTGAAHDVQASTTDEAPGDTALGSGTALDVATSVAPVLTVITGTGAAHDATTTTTGAGTADAGHASGSGSAFDATVSAVSAVVTPSGTSTAGRVRRRRRERAQIGFPELGPRRPSIHAIVYPYTARGQGEAFDASTTWDDDEYAVLLLLEVA